jgi:hypothetical protein
MQIVKNRPFRAIQFDKKSDKKCPINLLRLGSYQAQGEFMKVLRTIRRILALAVELWTLAVTVFFLFFAKVSFESTTASQALGGSLVVTATTSGQLPWLSQVEPFTVAVMIAFSLLLSATAFAEWRGALALAVPLSLLALIATFITGFSIGGLYFPGAAVSFLDMLLLAVEKPVSPQNRPTV